MNKSGDISAKTIIIVVLLIIGFGIALFFYWQLSWSGRADKETCHQSVVYRASLASIAEKAGDYVPLKCKTDKICITSGFFGGSCKEYEGLKGVAKVKVINIDQIQSVIAQNIVDCWGMMGEGRIDLFSQWIAKTYGVGSVYPSCVICSRIAFDMEGLKKADITAQELAKMNVEDYMRKHLIPNKQITYDQFLSGDSPAKVKITDEAASEIFGEGIATFNDLQQSAQQDLELQNKELAILFMQISSPKHGAAISNVGKTALGVAAGAFTASATTVGLKTTVRAGVQAGKLCLTWPWVCGGILAIAGIYQQGNIAVQRAKTAGYCGDVSVGDEARDGCSVVRTDGYNADDLSKYCAVIESIS